jgi:Cdc6-like AAA superfamily ATPase
LDANKDFMNFFDLAVETETFKRLRTAVNDGITPILLTGAAGSGKTTTLKLIERDWSNNEGISCFIWLREIFNEEDLFRKIFEQLNSQGAILSIKDQIIVGSSIHDVSDSILSLIKSLNQPLLLLLDGIDEAKNAYPILRVVRHINENSKIIIIVTGREYAVSKLKNKSNFEKLFTHYTIQSFSHNEFKDFFFKRNKKYKTIGQLDDLFTISEGNPLFAALFYDFYEKFAYSAQTDQHSGGY